MKTVNLKNRNTNVLNEDVTTALIDTVLEQTHSIMYMRQATYFFIMKLNGYNKKDVQFFVKKRAKEAGIDLNRGVLSRESSVAEYAIINLNSLFTDVKIDKKQAESCIKKIAGIMSTNDIKYNALKDKLVQPKAESADSIPQESDSQESENSVDSQESKTITSFEAVVKFIQSTTQENRLKLADVLATAIKANAEANAEAM